MFGARCWRVGLHLSDFVLTLLEKAHISVAPGTIFGPRGEGFVRISLVQPKERLETAMSRMKTCLH